MALLLLCSIERHCVLWNLSHAISVISNVQLESTRDRTFLSNQTVITLTLQSLSETFIGRICYLVLPVIGTVRQGCCPWPWSLVVLKDKTRLLGPYLGLEHWVSLRLESLVLNLVLNVESFVLGLEAWVVDLYLGPERWVLGPYHGLDCWVFGLEAWVLVPWPWRLSSWSLALKLEFLVLGLERWVLGLYLGLEHWVLGLEAWVLGLTLALNVESLVLDLEAWVLGPWPWTMSSWSLPWPWTLSPWPWGLSPCSK